MDKTGNIVKSSKKSYSFLDWITKYDSLVIFGGFGLAILLTIIFTGIFHAGPIVRDNILYNIIGAVGMSIAFIYLIFHFMGSRIMILGQPIDVGLVIYIAIVLFVMFILGN
jgi:hypothetical protein